MMKVKKITSVLMACMLALSPCTAAFAEENEAAEAAESAGVEEKIEVVGLTLTKPEYFVSGLKGILKTYPMGQKTEDIYACDFYYIAMDKDEFNAKQEASELSEEDQEAVRNAIFPFIEVLAIDNKADLAELIENDFSEDATEDMFNEIGKTDNYTFYYLEAATKDEFVSRIEPEFAEEFNKVYDDLIDALKNASFFDPMAFGSGMVGTTVSFETTDADGNIVKSEDIFAENEVTMLNLWETTCCACVGEMPLLVEMNHSYAGKGVAVVGICADADSNNEDFQQILEENGMDYLNLLPFEGMSDMFPVNGWPTSYFIGKDGTVLTVPVEGAPSDASYYTNIIDKLLAGDAVTAADIEPESNSHPNDAGVYRVHVTNGDGDPVEGVYVQFCSDTSCMMGQTDADGYASFETEEGVYTVHILKAPEGYEGTSEEFKTEDTFSDICVVLQKAA